MSNGLLAERGFFSLRYALPGYTLILIGILLFIPEIQETISSSEQATLLTAFLAFLFLFSGQALGFLVSQVWYLNFNHRIMGNYLWMSEKSKMVTETYKLNPEKYRRTVFFDYLYRLNINEQLKNIVERRYDLMHLTGSTLVSVFLGLELSLSTLFYRLITGSRLLSAEVLGVFFIILVGYGFLKILLENFDHVVKLHSMPFEIAVTEVVNNNLFTVERAKRVFPKDYFNSKKHKKIKQKE